MSVESEIARLTGLRDRMRTKLVDLDMVSDSADLEACTEAVESFSGPTGLVLLGTDQPSYASKASGESYSVEKTINTDPQYKNYIAVCSGYWTYTYTRSGTSFTVRNELMGMSLLDKTGAVIVKVGSPTVNTTVSDGSFTASAGAYLTYASSGIFLLRIYGVKNE